MAIIATQPGGAAAPTPPNPDDMGQGPGKPTGSIAESIAESIASAPYGISRTVGETTRHTVEGAKTVGRGAKTIGDAAAKGAKTIGDAVVGSITAVGRGAKTVSDAAIRSITTAGAGLATFGTNIAAGVGYQGERVGKGFDEGFKAAGPDTAKGADGPDR